MVTKISLVLFHNWICGRAEGQCSCVLAWLNQFISLWFYNTFHCTNRKWSVSFDFIPFFSISFISFYQGQKQQQLPSGPPPPPPPTVLFLILSVYILSFAQVKPLSEPHFKVRAAGVVLDSILKQFVHVRTFTTSPLVHLVGFAPAGAQKTSIKTKQFKCVVSSIIFFILPYVFPCCFGMGLNMNSICYVGEKNEWRGVIFFFLPQWCLP